MSTGHSEPRVVGPSVVLVGECLSCKTVMAHERTWRAAHRFARISPRKVRLVIDLIRGLGCDDALEQLRFNDRRSVRMIRDVLKSAT